MFERRLYYHIDWALVFGALALCALGVTTIYSATYDPTRGASHRYVIQLYAIGLGLIAMLVTMAVDSARRLQPAAIGVREDRRGAGAREVLRREPRHAVVYRSGARLRAHRAAARAHREGAGPGDRGDADPGVPGDRLSRGHADAH